VFSSLTGAGSFDCLFPDGPASSVVSASATDSDGDTGAADTQTVTVHNVAPIVTLSLANTLSVNEGTTHTYTFSISDPGADTVSAVTVDCGANGTLVAGSTTFNNSSGSFDCIFPDGPASSVVSASATDSDGDTGAADIQTVTIHNVAPQNVNSIIVLHPTKCDALTMTGNAKINVDDGNSHLEASKILVRGGANASGNATFSPAPITHIPPSSPYNSYFFDPLAGLTAPQLGTSLGSVNCSGNSSRTLDPGRYTQIKSSGNCVLTLRSGVYVVESGGFQVSGNASVSGQGVFVYNVSGSIDFSGNGNVNLTAPTTGDYAGILIFQARGNTRTMSFSGNANGIRGTVYVPAAQVSVSGNSALTFSLIVSSLRMSGNASIFMTAGEGERVGDTNANAVTGAGPLESGALISQSANVKVGLHDQLDRVFANWSFEPLSFAQRFGKHALPRSTHESGSAFDWLMELPRSPIQSRSAGISKDALPSGKSEHLLTGIGRSDQLLGGLGGDRHALDDALLEVVEGW
jgi:hypothetical protein